MGELVTYVALLDDSRNKPGEYTVTFPDVPEAITEGGNLSQALTRAREALGLALYDRDTLPKFRGLAELEEEYKNVPGILTFVTTDLDAIRDTVKIVKVTKNTSIPVDLAKQAEARNINFSALLTEALKKELQK